MGLKKGYPPGIIRITQPARGWYQAVYQLAMTVAGRTRSTKWQDFDPPLKRKAPTIPGYWTVEELASELDVSGQTVLHDIRGRQDRNVEPCLKAVTYGRYFFVAEEDALPYLRTRLKSVKRSA